MKITCTKRDDILKRQQENEEWYQGQNNKYQGQERAYHEADRTQSGLLEDAIRKEISQFVDPLQIGIYARSDYNFHNESYSYRVTIESHEGDKFNDNVALSWNYRIGFDDDGNVETETGSWSGLKARTEDQISDLKMSVECLEILNHLDWKRLLDSIVPPSYSEYVTEKNPQSEYQKTKSQLDQELLEADIEDIIGKDCVVEMRDPDNNNRKIWVQVFRETPSQYEVGEISDLYFRDTERFDNDKILDYLSNVLNKRKRRKDKFFDNLVKPLNIKQLYRNQV